MRNAFLLLPPLFLFQACAPTSPEADSLPDSFGARVPLAGAATEILEAAAKGETVRVIIELDKDFLDIDTEARFPGASRSSLEVRNFRQQLVADYTQLLIDDNLEITEIQRFGSLPYLIVELNSTAQAEKLMAHPLVRQLHAERSFEHQLTESLGLINQPEAQTSGYIGTGTSVAVLDTGVDFTRSAFGSCSSAGGSCAVSYAQDFAPSDSNNDDNGHGTNVAGIVLGVAPGTKILSLDVFRTDGYAYSSDILSALDWVVTNQATYNIQAINMSLGSGRYYSDCTSDTFASGIQEARDAGILSAIASGNSAYSNSISSPSCVPAAVSVGAVYDANLGGLSWSNCTDSTTAADKVTCFSNSDDTVELLAPGALITAAGSTMGGTSQATPHVAGAIAVLRAAFPDDSVSETVTRLSTTGTTITDTRNGLTFPRIDLNAALELGGALDATGPTGSVVINSGSTATKTTSVTLTIDATDESGVSQMCISNSTSCTSWLSYATSKSWTISSTPGDRAVYIWFKDTFGNVSAAYSDSILLDTSAPSNGTVTALGSDGSASVSWTGFSDSSSGIASYTLVYSSSTYPASSCTNGTTAYTGSGTSTTLSALSNGSTYYLRVCATDVAGNTSTGSTTSIRPAAEYDAPTGTVSINGGDVWTKSTAVTLTLSATDASGVSKMCISNSTSCSSWMTYTTTKSWTLSATNGTRTVYVWYQDANGNKTSTYVSDNIGVDTVAPSNGTMTATGRDGGADISWSGFSDATSGIASYKLVGSTSSAPSSCSVGTLLWTGTETSASLNSLTNGTTWYLRLCAVDVAGNTSSGKTGSVRAAPEFSAPTDGSIVINGGASAINTTQVTLTLSAEDASGVAKMCISNSSTCTSWMSYATTKTWTMSSTGKVYVWFQDTYGNSATTSVYDTIIYDVTKPGNGVVTGSSAGGSINLDWDGFSDGSSGIASYTVVYATGSTAPSSCSTGTMLGSGITDTNASLSGASVGTSYSFRVCAVDAAGNVSSGAKTTVTAQ
jgi:hypothetical protein